MGGVPHPKTDGQGRFFSATSNLIRSGFPGKLRSLRFERNVRRNKEIYPVIKQLVRRSSLALVLGAVAVATLTVAPKPAYAGITGTDPCPKYGCMVGSSASSSVSAFVNLQIILALSGLA